ncbi:MAG: hypothetical protein JSV26_03900 [bacterium]|nr:MAG: hypothetical protein JSV26_03900 [bacterium]
MKPEEFESFLRETAPRLGYRWRPLNRRNIRRKIQRRMDSLRIRDPGLYRDRVLADPAERILLESLFRVTISRFFRNVSVWQDLRQVILEEVTCIPSRGLSAWCAGSAGGEEPYSLAMLLMSMEEEGEIGPSWKVVGTETHDISLVRAREGAYQWGSIREVPERMRERWFVRVGEDWILSDDVKGRVLLLRRDLLRDPPPDRCHLVLLRNSILTYNTEDSCMQVLAGIRGCLEAPGLLVIGRTETLPGAAGFERVRKCIYRKRS